ncbi:MAG: hypothetical protein U0163_03640 [Gemmatimonadaceae bacterium]
MPIGTRILVVIKNVGTRAVKGPVLIRFYSDSANGEAVQTPSDIVGLGDSTSNGGRIAYWRYDAVLQPGSAFQVLMPGATSARRWLELRGTNWDKKVRAKLFSEARYTDAVSVEPPDTASQSLMDSLGIVLDQDGKRVRSQLVAVDFDPTATQAQRQTAIDLVGGVIIGGDRWLPSDGTYYVRIPWATSYAAISSKALLKLDSLPYGSLLRFRSTHSTFESSAIRAVPRTAATRDRNRSRSRDLGVERRSTHRRPAGLRPGQAARKRSVADIRSRSRASRQ